MDFLDKKKQYKLNSRPKLFSPLQGEMPKAEGVFYYGQISTK